MRRHESDEIRREAETRLANVRRAFGTRELADMIFELRDRTPAHRDALEDLAAGIDGDAQSGIVATPQYVAQVFAHANRIVGLPATCQEPIYRLRGEVTSLCSLSAVAGTDRCAEHGGRQMTKSEQRRAETCGRCHGVLPREGGVDQTFVLYLYPGERDRYEAGQTTNPRRTTVHAQCIADEVAEGRLVRVSPFAFEVTA